MTRALFIKNIIASFGLSVLPDKLIKHYKRIYLLQSFIRGFRFYEGPQLMGEMKEADLLELVREPENQHDPCAIALHFNTHKIGYLPRESNELLSRLLDAEVIPLMVEITNLKPEAATWENVHLAVYVLKDVRTTALPDKASYLTSLETPHYRTLKYGKDEVMRISYEDKNPSQTEDTDYQMDGAAFYEALVENSTSDEIYTIIHTGFPDATSMNRAISESKILINRKHVPRNMDADVLIRSLDDHVIELNDLFGENGYVVANINRLAELSHRIERFVEIIDKSGQKFFEAVLKP